MDFGKSKSNWIFPFGLDYFGCGCPHAKLNWMSNQYWMSKHELLILLLGGYPKNSDNYPNTSGVFNTFKYTVRAQRDSDALCK
jgi:hypothetical protein